MAKNYIKENLFQFLGLIPVCFIAIGSFVLNIYLHQFGIFDIALFDSKTIFIGFVVVFQIICYFFIFFSFLGSEKIKAANGSILIGVNMLWKPVLFTIIAYSFFFVGDDYIRLQFSVWRCNFDRILMAISICAFFGLILLHGAKNIVNLNTKKDKILVDAVGIIELISIYEVYIIHSEDRIFQGICEIYMALSVVYFIFAIILIYGKDPLVIKEKESSFFRLGDKPMQLDYYCAYFGIIVFLMVALALYSTRIFPYISNNLGGGYYKFNTIVLDDDETITGRIIYSNNKYVYIMEEENQLSQYSIDKIKRYEIREKIEINFNDCDFLFIDVVEEDI